MNPDQTGVFSTILPASIVNRLLATSLVAMAALFLDRMPERAIFAQETEVEKTMGSLLDAASGRTPAFHLRAVLQVPIDGEPEEFLVDVYRNQQQFDVSLVGGPYALTLRRRPEGTALALPRHRVVFIGKGEIATPDHLGFDGLLVRMISTMSDMGQFAPIMLTMQPAMVFNMAKSAMGAKIDEQGKILKVSDMQIRSTMPGQVAASVSGMKLRAGVTQFNNQLAPFDDWPGYRIETLDRDELERTVMRGFRRATEIMMPGSSLKSPVPEQRQVENGQSMSIDGQRVVILRGTPQQIGRAHGELIGFEVNTCIDSVLHTFGLFQTVTTGRWFRHDLDSAFARLESHIPQEFRDENLALAQAIEQPPAVIDALNVFPELFHCSGFALMGSATNDGKLYHGRVLDYMTSIGLHDAATTFIVIPNGQIPFVHVGYAGFTGCVSGMNQAQLSIGEMKAPGSKSGDGIPMATLIRIALQKCSTLDEVLELWTKSPRTCENYYLVADGKAKDAIGIAASPEQINVVRSGESHPQLGEGIPDTVMISADERMDALRKRVLEKHGTFDGFKAIELMARPVSTKSNLHNVLFVPSDGVLFVAHADHRLPAADRNYIKIDFQQLLNSP